MEFAITFDYLCPFARNAVEAVLAGVEEGRDWKPVHRPFSLAQVHLDKHAEPVWEQPEGRSGVLALQWGLAVRDEFGDWFPAVHKALFAARHDNGRDINDEAVIRQAVSSTGLDADSVGETVATGAPLKVLGTEHTEAQERWAVFGVPTFILGEEAAFARVMERGRSDDVARLVEMLTWTRLNEFKRTRVPR